ncbi:uncharacterized protein [Haliotis asinina]|uniref:uncharacterized protein n=1 Tax=Haliotis asinina TaxID=109174 RepID=UPI003531F8C8
MDGHELFSCIICITLMVMVPGKALKRSESCFIPPPTPDCAYHRLQCASGERIEISEIYYVAKSDKLDCLNKQLNCSAVFHQNCCKQTRGETTPRFFNTTDSERIKTQCSNKRKCEFPAHRTPSLIFSVVTYECIQGKPIAIATGTMAAVAISGIVIAVLCYSKRQRKQSPQEKRTRLNSALSPLYHEVIDAQSFPRQTASYEYATLEDVHGGGPGPKPVVAGYDHLGFVSRGVDARGLGVHYDTASCAMPVSQQERTDDEGAREGSILYNHLSVNPQRSKVLHNHYDVAMSEQ